MAAAATGVLALVLGAAGGDGDAATDPVLVAAGDIAPPRGAQAQTAALLGDATVVATLGDHAYPDGSLSQFRAQYDPSWGTVKSKTRPVPGNHEYATAGADGYKSYFGSLATPSSSKTWYSYNLGAWHIIALDSNCASVGGCGEGSAQHTWLRSDLNTSQRCILAYWHHPRWSSTKQYASMAAFWKLLYAKRADVVLNGHAHNYERFTQKRPDGSANADGIRQFVVGTGGVSLKPFSRTAAGSQERNANTHGVLKLTLGDTGYSWRFMPVAGRSYTDTGSDACH